MNRIYPAVKRRKSKSQTTVEGSAEDSEADSSTSAEVSTSFSTGSHDDGQITILAKIASENPYRDNNSIISEIVCESDSLFIEDFTSKELRLRDEHETFVLENNSEEERLKQVFVNKNTIDDEFDLENRTEEQRLMELTDQKSIDNGTFGQLKAHAEEDQLNVILENKVVDKYEDKELSRLQDIINSKKGDNIVLVDFNEPDEEQVAENAKLISSCIVESTLQEENAHDCHTQSFLQRHSSRKRENFHSHYHARLIEEDKFMHIYQKEESLKKRESQILIKQHTRKNLNIVDDEKSGKIKHRTSKGILNFETADSFEFVSENNKHANVGDCKVVRSNKRHVHHQDCRYENQIRKLFLPKDVTLENFTASFQDFASFYDATGVKRHSARDDCTFVSITRAHFVLEYSFKHAINNHMSFKDVLFLDHKSHESHNECDLHNHDRQHDLCKEGVIVQRASSMSIPLANTTEFRNESTHHIPTQASVINRAKLFTLNPDSTFTKTVNHMALCEDGEIIQNDLSFVIPLSGSQDDHDRLYFIPKGGSQDEHSNQHFVPEGTLINNCRGHFVAGPRKGDVSNRYRCYHHHHIQDSYTPWRKSRFSIPLEGSLDHDMSFGNSDDASWTPCKNEYDISDELSIDDEYLKIADE